MKKIFLLIFLAGSLMMNAQVPQGINYQAVVRTANGAVASNTSGIFQITFIDKADNSIDYVESNDFTTDEFGLVDFVIGHGVPNGAAFTSLDWTRHFQIKVEVNLGQGLVTLGTQDLVSVPYAMEAGHVNMSLNQLSDVDVTGAVSGEVLMFDGTSWIPAIVSGGFGLPYLANDSNLTSFAITNNSALGGTAVYGKTTTNSANANGVKGESTAALGNGVYGKATGASSNGVQGLNTTGTGVRGESNSGAGVLGYSNSNVGVSAGTISGTALVANSVSGYALETSGKVKIAGGNTAPGTGKVLTSDSQGNATWQSPNATPKVAFRCTQTTTSAIANVLSRVEFDTEDYDFGNAFTPKNASSSSSTFTTPIAGVYRFDASVNLMISGSLTNCFSANEGSLVLKTVFADGSVHFITSAIPNYRNTTTECQFWARLSTEIALPAGAKVFIEVYQVNDDDINIVPLANSTTYFNGSLVFEN